MRVELVSLNQSNCFVAGEDDVDLLMSREVGSASFLQCCQVDKAGFLIAMSRFRGQPEDHVYRIIVWAGSDEEQWAKEMLADIEAHRQRGETGECKP